MSQIPDNNNSRLMGTGSVIVSRQRHTSVGVTTLRVFRSKRMTNTGGRACYILVKLTSQTPWFAWFFNQLRSIAFANLQLKKQQPGDQLKGGAFSTGCWSVFAELYEWSHLTGKPPGQNLHESMGQHRLGAIDTWSCSLCRNYYLTKYRLAATVSDRSIQQLRDVVRAYLAVVFEDRGPPRELLLIKQRQPPP